MVYNDYVEYLWEKCSRDTFFRRGIQYAWSIVHDVAVILNYSVIIHVQCTTCTCMLPTYTLTHYQCNPPNITLVAQQQELL